ncbi:sigma-70 family RNA polymerase sigma factor [Moorellaceae bacterium AZ2]
MFFRKEQKRGCSPEVKQLLYEAYFDRIYRCALFITHDPAAAEEVVQETFAIAFEKYNQLRDPAKTGAWLVAIAINVIRANRNQNKKLVLLTPEDMAQLQICSIMENLENTLEQREIVEALKAAIRKLPAEFRDILILKYYAELEVEEIASVLEIPAGTVKSRLNRAREKLCKTLTDNKQFTDCKAKGVK